MSDPSLAFIDESGLTKDPGQPEIAVGVLTVHRNHLILHQRLRNIFLAAVTQLRATEEKFEFKFTYITPRSLPFYEQLLAVLAASPNDWSFRWSVESRNHQHFWEQYVSLCKRVLASLPGRYVVLADHLNKPRRIKHGLSSLENDAILKILQIESQGTVFLQMTDVLLGALMFHRRSGTDIYKTTISNRAMALLIKTGAGIDPIYATPNMK